MSRQPSATSSSSGLDSPYTSVAQRSVRARPSSSSSQASGASGSQSGNNTQGHSRKKSSSSSSSKGHLPTIPTSTAQLLTATKSLLQSLTQWAAKKATVNDVSSRFVRVGDDFKTLKKSWTAAGLDVSNVPDIPNKLRKVLEDSLVLEPCKESLDKFLPRVGAIIADLMKVLKEKQGELQRLSESRRASAIPFTSPDAQSSPLNGIMDEITLKKRQPTASSSTDSILSSLTKDPIARLQNNHALARRASKRFSAYQTSKILSMNQSANSSPLPNRVLSSPDRARASQSDPTQSDLTQSELAQSDLTQSMQDRAEREIESEIVKPEVQLMPSSPLQDEVCKNLKESEMDKRLSATLSRSVGTDDDRDRGQRKVSVPGTPRAVRNFRGSNGNDRIYLKIGNQVKKVDLKLPTTAANLKVLFTQKFGYSPAGAYPKIYVQESPNEIAYEMEDVSEVQPGSVLSLEQPDMATVICEHLDTKMELLRDDISKVQELARVTTKKPLDDGNSDELTKGIATRGGPSNATVQELKKEIEELKFELAKARQRQRKTKEQLTGNVGDALELVQKLQTIGLSPNGVINNPYMEHCKTKVSSECESLVSRIDNLQDLIEVLKVDISKRRSRPSDKQLQTLQKEMDSTKDGLESLTRYMVSEKKNWNARWQSELTAILEEQEFFKEQETIVQLLGEDLGSADETFNLIQKCCDELSKNAQSRRGPHLPLVDPSVSMQDVKSQVLQQVESLNPDHDQRVEAIAKAEKVREMEKAMLYQNEFEEELDNFVGNSKLKNSGGIEEVERQRQMKDEENMKSSFGVI